MPRKYLRAFSEYLAVSYRDLIGIPVPHELAWNVFRIGFEAVLEYLMSLEINDRGEQRLPLRGLGTFIISWQDPVQVEGKPSPLMDRLLEEGIQVPRFRWTPSTKIKDYVIERLTGFDRDGNPVTEQAALQDDGEELDD